MNQSNTKPNNSSIIIWGVVLGLVLFGLTALVLTFVYINKDGEQSTKDTSSNNYAASTYSEVQTPAPPPSDKDENGCYTPSTVRKHYGETDCVVFTVAYTYETSAGTKFIDEKVDYKNGFAVYIPRDSNFSTVELSQFEGKKIKATGLISEYNGSPQIEATEYSQVTIFR